MGYFTVDVKPTIAASLQHAAFANRDVLFDWTDDAINKQGGIIDDYYVKRKDTGLIAQEVEKVLPEVIRERDDGYKAIQYDKFIGLAVQSINELADSIDKLKEEYGK